MQSVFAFWQLPPWVVGQFDARIDAGEEGEFFIGGVYSLVLDPNKKRSLTKYHGKLAATSCQR